MMVANEMVAMIDFAEVEREKIVVTYSVVHSREDMMASLQDRNGMNGLALSILVSKVKRIVHDEIYSHAPMLRVIIIFIIGIYKCIIAIKMWFKSHTCTYLWLVSLLLPWHVMAQVRNALLQVQLLILVWRGTCWWHGSLHKSRIYQHLSYQQDILIKGVFFYTLDKKWTTTLCYMEFIPTYKYIFPKWVVTLRTTQVKMFNPLLQ